MQALIGQFSDEDQSKAAMYSAAKYQQERQVEAQGLRGGQPRSPRMSPGRWSPTTSYKKLTARPSIKANKLMQQDQTILWSLPPDALQLQAQFRLSEELTSAARKKRLAAQRDIGAADAMPAEITGYVLTQTLKSGVRLCTAYNVSKLAMLTPTTVKGAIYPQSCCSLVGLAEVSTQRKNAEGSEPSRRHDSSRCNLAQCHAASRAIKGAQARHQTQPCVRSATPATEKCRKEGGEMCVKDGV